jgi:carbonic anhydrase/acetyltransferase-like protein (isoleucine patch superfamily)
VRAYRGVSPRIDPTAWIAPGAVVVGDVEIGRDSSIWYGTLLRGDVHAIRIGCRTNLQDGSIVHVTAAGSREQLNRMELDEMEALWQQVKANSE